MIDRIVEIETDNRHLAVERGFLLVQHKGETLGRVPLDDIGAVIANAHGMTFSAQAAKALLSRNAPLVICGSNHMPEGVVWPVAGHHAQTARMRAQIACSRPLAKRIWRDLVCAKILMQAAALRAARIPDTPVARLAAGVRAGDPDNREAQAARRYWPALMGPDFRRDPSAPGVNGLLNYGYAVLRASAARAVMAAGLHPTLGVFHDNRINPMGLVDDLMEPFRPVIDLAVRRLVGEGRDRVDRETKPLLAGLMLADLETRRGVSPMAACVKRLAVSLAAGFDAGQADLDLPAPALSIPALRVPAPLPDPATPSDGPC